MVFSLIDIIAVNRSKWMFGNTMKMAAKCFHLFVFVFLSVGGKVSGSFCAKGQAKPDDPSLPVIDATAFTIEYQINIIDRNYTMWAREDYDYNSNKARMLMLRDGIEEGLIMDYNDNLMASYFYGDVAKSTYTCTIDQLNTSTSDNFDVFGGRPSGSKSMPHIYSSRDVFSFSSDLSETYMGRTTIDGMEVDHWQSCMYWADDKDNFTLDYYFTTLDWTPVDATGPTQIPVRAVVKGIKSFSGGNTYTLNHVYEYLNFRTFATLPDDHFDLPEDMKCEDSKGLRKKSLPDLPNRMSYVVEIVDSDVRIVEVLYDEDRGLVSSFENGVVSIDDFNSGVHYSNDRVNHLCSTRLISSQTDFDAVSSSNSVKMKGRDELFFLDGDFTYTGQEEFRGILCDAWDRTMIFEGTNSNVEVLFSATGEIYRNTNTGQKLVSLIVSTDQKVVTYNFFDQLPNPDIRHNPFDISACRNESTSKHFRMVLSYYQFPGIFKEHTYDSYVHDALSSFTANVTGVNPILVQWTDLEVDDDNNQLHWFGSLLGPDPISVQTQTGTVKTPVSLDDAWNILQQFVKDGKFVTTVLLTPDKNGFRMDPELTAIELTIVNSDIDYTDADENSLRHFSVVKDSYPSYFYPQESLTAASVLDCADLCIQRTIYDCRVFYYCFESKTCQLSSNSSIAPLQGSKGCNTYTRDYTSDFVKVPGKSIRPANEISSPYRADVQVCASMCLQAVTFHCESFDYCEPYSCYFGHDHYYGTASSDVQTTPSCDHYSRDYISDYTKSEKTTLTSQVSPNVMLTVDNAIPQRCAYMCSKDVPDCVRFSYCSSTQQCQLATTSSLKDVKTQGSSVCDVYSLSFAVTSGLANSTTTKGDSGGTYSGGAMAGLAIGMIMVGVLLCVAVVLLLRRFNIWNPV